jgi:hypothetical protein
VRCVVQWYSFQNLPVPRFGWPHMADYAGEPQAKWYLTPSGVSPMRSASSRRVIEGSARSAAMILSWVVSWVVFRSRFLGKVNSIHNPEGSYLSAGSGTAAPRHASKMSSIPRPQASIIPARKKAFATSGLNGRKGCLCLRLDTVPLRLSNVTSSGSRPAHVNFWSDALPSCRFMDHSVHIS